MADEGSANGARRRGRRGGRRERTERNEVPADNQDNQAVANTPVSPEDLAGATGISNASTAVESVERVAAAASDEVKNVDLPEQSASIAEVVAPAAGEHESAKAKDADEGVLSADTESADEPIEAPVVVAQTPVVDDAPVVDAPIAQTPVAEIVLEAPVAPALPPEETVTPAPLPPVEPIHVVPAANTNLDQVLASSGLVMVETSGDKAQAWQPEQVSSEDAPRPRRKRTVAVPVADEPLMMVETQK
jgi:ribonuclease E